MNGAAFVLAVGVPIFAYIVSLAASLFASWYTYGIAGAFWLFDAWHDHGKWAAYKRWPVKFGVNVATFFAGAFICVAGESEQLIRRPVKTERQADEVRRDICQHQVDYR